MSHAQWLIFPFLTANNSQERHTLCNTYVEITSQDVRAPRKEFTDVKEVVILQNIT